MLQLILFDSWIEKVNAALQHLNYSEYYSLVKLKVAMGIYEISSIRAIKTRWILISAKKYGVLTESMSFSSFFCKLVIHNV